MNELKELLKLPFKTGTRRGEYIVDLAEQEIFLTLYTLYNSKVSKTKEKLIIKWVAEALNEKYERDFAEPKKWLKVTVNNEMVTGDIYICPECKADYNFKAFNFCPNCGIKLQAE